MKKYKSLSIKLKVPLMMGIASLTVLSLVCLLLLMPLRRNSLNDSSKIAQLTAVEAGKYLAEEINEIAKVVRTYSGLIESLAETDFIPRDKKREWLLSEMEMTVNKKQLLNNLWCTLEPNVLDGMDAYFAGREDKGSDAKGVFAPWFVDGKLIASASGDDYQEDFYVIPKRTQREVITEPYFDDVVDKNMFSICIPIMVKGKFIGVVGSDFEAAELKSVIEDLNRNTSGKLITDQGIIAVHQDEEQIGTLTEYGDDEILNRLLRGEMFEGIFNFDGEQIYKVYVPVQLGVGTKPWFYVVDVPVADIFLNAKEITKNLIVYCIIGVVLIAIVGFLLIRSLLNNVIDTTDIIHDLALGKIDMHVSESQNSDEIGKMKNELLKLLDGLKNTATFAQSIGKGDLVSDYNLLSADDVLGNSLLEMRKNLQNATQEQEEHRKVEEQRSWGTTGLAKFAEILRQDNDNMEALAYNVISNMVKYLGANQGGIFILNEVEQEEDMILELKASYAFDRKKYTEKVIRPGEGLVGACFLEGEQIYVTDVPNSYINITSGLGKANPSSVLISPLKVNDEMYGVIEIASFKEFEPYQLEFVQKVGESIAATISTVRVNIRTAKLLEQTKVQAEEMANAEEELRQSMEEMQATQEDMRRREIEIEATLSKMKDIEASEEDFKNKVQWYEALLDAIEDTPISVTDMNKTVTFLNASALAILGKTREEVIGKHCGDVWNVDICKDERCGIECLKRGIEKSRFHVGENVFTTRALYIKDSNGNNIGHIELVSNITGEEYSRRAVEKLAVDISKLSAGNINVDFKLEKPREQTQELYDKYNIIASNLENVRDMIRDLKK